MTQIDLTKKRCSGCVTWKSRLAFSKNRSCKDGLYQYCKSCVAIRNKREREEKPEQVRTRKRRDYEKNREGYAEYHRNRYALKRDEINAAWRAQPKTDEERAAARKRHSKWRAENPQSVRQYAEKRRAQKAGGWIEDVNRETLWVRDAGVCRLCNTAADPKLWHVEHLTPLSRGGEHSYANCAVAHPWCNWSKNNLTFEEWMESGRLRCHDRLML